VLGHSIGIDLSINGAHDCTILDSTGRLAQRFTFDSSSAGLLKLEQRIRALDSSHSAHTVVMEPTGLAWLLPCLYLRAQLPDVKVVRIKTSKVAALRRYLKQDAKSDRLDSLTLAKMPLVDPEQLYAVDLPPAALQGLDRMTRHGDLTREMLEETEPAFANSAPSWQYPPNQRSMPSSSSPSLSPAASCTSIACSSPTWTRRKSPSGSSWDPSSCSQRQRGSSLNSEGTSKACSPSLGNRPSLSVTLVAGAGFFRLPTRQVPLA